MSEKRAALETTLEQERKAQEDAVARLNLPPDTTVRPTNIEGIHGEWLSCNNNPNESTILFLYGAGYNAGSYLTDRGLAARLACATGLTVLTIVYRLAPEFPFSYALEDTVKVYQWPPPSKRSSLQAIHPRTFLHRTRGSGGESHKTSHLERSG